MVLGGGGRGWARGAGGKGAGGGERQAGGEGADDAGFQHFGEGAAAILVERRGDAVEGVGDDGDKRMPLVGEREAARQAVEQAGAEAAFELRHLMADGALADAQFDRGAGEVEVARRGVESAKSVERELGAVQVAGINYSHGFVEK